MEKIVVQEPKNETPRQKEPYRAPQLVPLGTAVGLVQGRSGPDNDGYTAWFRPYYRR